MKPFKGAIEDAEKAGNKLGFKNAEIKEGLGSLVVATHSGAKALKDLGLAEDVARFKHVGMAEATKMLTSTLAGNVRSAKALGIVLLPVTAHVDALRRAHIDLSTAAGAATLRHAKLADKLATAAQALGKVKDAVGGVAKGFSETSAGKMAAFHAQIDALKESLGTGLLPAVHRIVDKLGQFAAVLARHPDLVKNAAIALGIFAIALLGVAAAAFIAENAMTFGLAAAITALALGVTYLITHFDKVKAALSSLGSWIAGHAYVLLAVPIIGPILALGVFIASHWEQIKGFVVNAMHAVSNAVSSGWNAVKNTVVGAMNAVVGAVRAGWNAVTGAIHAAVGAVTGAATAVGHAIVAGVVGGLATLIGRVRAGLGRIAGAISSVAASAVGWAAEIGHQIISGVLSGLGGLASALKSKVEGMVHSALSHLNPFSSVEHGGEKYIGKPIIDGAVKGVQDNGWRLAGAVVGAVRGAVAAGAAAAAQVQIPLSFQIAETQAELTGNVDLQIAALQQEAVFLASLASGLDSHSQRYLDVLQMLLGVNNQIKSLTTTQENEAAAATQTGAAVTAATHAQVTATTELATAQAQVTASGRNQNNTLLAVVETIKATKPGTDGLAGSFGNLAGQMKAGIQSAGNLKTALMKLDGTHATTFLTQIVTSIGGGIDDGSGGSGRSGGSRIPRFAGGGPATGGMPYIVGERGPELFVPQSSGSVVPRAGAGGGVVFQKGAIQVMGSVVTERDLVNSVRQGMLAEMRRLGGGEYFGGNS
jgi:hypothetical protein